MRALEKRREDEKKGASKVLERIWHLAEYDTSVFAEYGTSEAEGISETEKDSSDVEEGAFSVKEGVSEVMKGASDRRGSRGGGTGAKPLAYRNDALGRQSPDAIKDL